MNRFCITLLAGGVVLGLSNPAFAFRCPTEIAAIDEALQTAELSDEERQQVTELRDEGERLHNEGDHQASLDTLAEAKEILGIE